MDYGHTIVRIDSDLDDDAFQPGVPHQFLDLRALPAMTFESRSGCSIDGQATLPFLSVVLGSSWPVAVGTTIADRPPHRSVRALISAYGSYLK